MFCSYLYFFPKKRLYIDLKKLFLYNYSVKMTLAMGGAGSWFPQSENLWRAAAAALPPSEEGGGTAIKD